MSGTSAALFDRFGLSRRSRAQDHDKAAIAQHRQDARCRGDINRPAAALGRVDAVDGKRPIGFVDCRFDRVDGLLDEAHVLADEHVHRAQLPGRDQLLQALGIE